MLGITVGVDGSDNSRRALDWAMREAAARRCPMTVITVHEVVPSLWTGDPVTTRADEALQHRARDAAVAAATAAAERLGENQPTAVKVRAVSGFAAQELINASGVTDLLVIGARGGGFSHRLALGSVSSQVVHHADCPVVVVPEPARTRGAGQQTRSPLPQRGGAGPNDIRQAGRKAHR
ncbi:MAG TPA: universal stress protein [Streptosporangiaceae bacterium]|jgi:nucleotide-binding universal stress UspA family protein